MFDLQCLVSALFGTYSLCMSHFMLERCFFLSKLALSAYFLFFLSSHFLAKIQFDLLLVLFFPFSPLDLKIASHILPTFITAFGVKAYDNIWDVSFISHLVLYLCIVWNFYHHYYALLGFSKKKYKKRIIFFNKNIK